VKPAASSQAPTAATSATSALPVNDGMPEEPPTPRRFNVQAVMPW
jgi:hypothetical protein